MEDGTRVRVPQLPQMLNLVLEPYEAAPPLLDQRHLVTVAVAQQAPGEVRPDLAAACDEDVHGLVGDRLPRLDLTGSCGLEQVGNRGLRRRDRAQSQLPVEVGGRRIQEPADEAL